MEARVFQLTQTSSRIDVTVAVATQALVVKLTAIPVLTDPVSTEVGMQTILRFAYSLEVVALILFKIIFDEFCRLLMFE
jgi:hypothetical protein